MSKLAPPKIKRKKVGKPNAAVYLLAYLLVFPALKILFRLKVDRTDYHPPKGPFVVLCNHQSYMDFLLAMLSLYPYRVNTVAAQKFFLYRPLDWFLPLMGSIPKNLFDPDLRSIKSVLEVIRRGDQLLLFPEGRCSVHGPYMGIHKATGKLIKLLKVPVYSCYIEGAYACMPFWRDLFRRGRVRVTLAELFTAEETLALSAEEINDRIDARLSGIDYAVGAASTSGLGYTAEAFDLGENTQPPCHCEDSAGACGNNTQPSFHSEDSAGACGNPENLLSAQEYLGMPDSSQRDEGRGDSSYPSNRPLPYLFRARRLAEGLEHLLYYCPRCKQEFTMETSGNTIRCTVCGNEATMNRVAELVPTAESCVPRTVADWYREQIIHEMQFLHEGAEFIRVEVTVKMPLEGKFGLHACGRGELSLDCRGWRFVGELFGEQVDQFFSIDTVPAVPFDCNDSFQIYANGYYYTYVPEDNPSASSKYATIGECAYWRFASEVQMTSGYNSGFSLAQPGSALAS